MVRKSRELTVITLFFLLMITSNASASEDILKVDKTLFVQLIIFIVAIFILNSLLFKPLIQLVDRREKLTTGTIAEAKRIREELEKIRDEYSSLLNEARSQAILERSEIRRQAQLSSEEIIKRAREENQAFLDESTKRLESETREIEEKIKPTIEILAKDVASIVLKKEV
jgi:F-type H+-transporting ATPase subunit b